MTATPRKRVRAALVNGVASALAWAVFLLAAPLFRQAPGTVAPADRLAFAARLAAWPAALLFLMATAVMLVRARSGALNPIDDAESRLYRVSQRALANSVEQTLIFLPALAALATLADAAWLGVLQLVVALFLAGRILFWLGYLLHPYARAPGMAVTWNVNLGLLAYVLWRLVAG